MHAWTKDGRRLEFADHRCVHRGGSSCFFERRVQLFDLSLRSQHSQPVRSNHSARHRSVCLKMPGGRGELKSVKIVPVPTRSQRVGRTGGTHPSMVARTTYRHILLQCGSHRPARSGPFPLPSLTLACIDPPPDRSGS